MGTAEPGSTIDLYSGTTLIGTATTNSSGNWTAPITTTLSAGTYSDITATSTLQSNLSPSSNTYVAVIETAATTPVISGLTPATDTGSSSTDGITSNTTPVITGTGEANAVLTVKDGTSTLGTVTVGTNGTWSLSVGSALSAGSQSLVATEVDQAGNASAPSNTYVAVIETAATTPVISGLTPATDTGSSSTDGITSNTTPVITGTGEANAVLTVKDGTSTLGTVTVGTNGTWSLSVGSALSAGSQSLVATEVDQAGNASAPSNTYVAVIETAATTPVISGLTPATDTGSSSTDGITSNTTPVITGTGEANAVLTVKDGTSTLGTVTVGTNGTWSLSVGSALSAGSQSLVATEVDQAGNASAPSNTYVAVIETAATTPVISGLTPATDTGSSSTDGITSNTTPVITGTGEANAVLTVKDGTSTLGTVTVGTNGTWSLSVGSALSAGSQSLVATEVDQAGNASAPSNTYVAVIETAATTPVISGLTPATDTGSSSTDGITSNTTPVITGTGEANAVLTVKDGTSTLGTVTVGTNGTWSLSVGSALSAGSQSLVATEVDQAGNASAPSNTYVAVIETAATTPVISGLTPATDTGSSSTDGITSNTTPVITGTGEANAVLTVKDGTSTLGTVTVGTNGTWSLSVGSALSAGSQSLVATEVDQAGNASAPSNTYVAVIETAATTPVISGLTPATDTGSSSTDGITSNTTPVITGTGEANAVLTVKDGTSTLGTVTVGTNGTWSLSVGSALSAGSQSLVATEVDQAGNASAPSNTYVAVIETAATTPVISGLTPATDTGSSSTDGITSNTTPVITGTGEANAVLTVKDGTSTLGTVTVGTNGTWSLSVGSALSAGSQSLVATEVDQAGNASAPSNTYVAVIETAATTPVISGLTPATDTGSSSTDGITSNTTPVITGTGEANAVLTVKDGTSTLGTVTVGTNGTWSLSVGSALSAGSQSLVATEVDQAGNASAPSNTYVAVIETAATTPVISGLTPATDTGSSSTDGITSNTTPVITGTGEANAVLTVKDGTSTLGTVTVGTNGTWSLSVGSALSAGSQSLVATEVDQAGNASAPSNTYVAVIETAATTPVISGLTPATDTGSSSTDGITSNTTPVITGTGEANAVLTVKDGTSTLGTVTVGTNGTWSLSVGSALSAGSQSLVATEVDQAGNASAPSNTYVAVIETAATTPVISGLTPATDTGSSSTDGITSNTTPVITGTGEANAVLTVKDGTSTLGTVTVGTNGTWSLSVGSALSAGSQSLVATEVDQAGNASAPSNTYVAVIETAATTPVISGLTPATDTGSSSTDGITSNTTPVITGTGEANAVLTVKDGTSTLGTVTVGTNGTWSLSVGSALSAGSQSLVATEVDQAGNASAPSNTYVAVIETAATTPVISGLTPATDTGSSSTDGITSNTTPVITGTGEANAVLTVKDGTSTLGTVTVGTNGTWSLSVGSALSAGSQSLVATEVDQAGNASAPSNTYVAVIETAATTPVISGLTPATDTGSSSTDGITSNTTPVITGTGEANAVLTVKDGTSTLGTVTVGTNGTWSLSVGSALSAGSQSLVATEVDQAGNASAPSNTYVAVIETAATTPVISGLTPATDTGSSSTDGITSNTTPVITGTGEANAVLTVKDGTSTLGTVTVGTNGTWSLSVGSALSAGSQSLVATEVDQAGNASAPSNTYVAVIETAATTPVISGLTPATDTGSSSTDGITSNTTPVITGTGEANAVLTVKDGTSTLGTVTVGTNGTWSLSVGSALSAGSQSLVATEVDQAGNASAPSNTYVAVIETAATTPVISGLTPATDTGSSSTDGITSNTTPVITGTGEANAVLTVKDGTSTLGTVTVGTNGTWSLSVGSALSAGSQSLVATEVDQAGNASAPSNTYVAVIETAATTPVISGLTPATDTGSSSTDGITSNTTPVITGTGEANAVLTVKDGTSTLGTVTVGTNGTWSLSVGSALSAGSQSLVATEVDQAGNASAPSNTYVAVIETAATTPVISGLTPATDTGSSSTDGITSNTTPVITGTGEANAVLTVKDGTSTLGTVTVGTNGTWSLSVGSALSAGSQSLVATEVDQAGNASAPSNTYVAVIETAATTPVISGLTPATDTGSSSTDGITSNTTPVITGTGEANAVLTVKDGTSTLGTVTVGTNGTWSLSVGSALSAGSQSLVATEVDQAGNASAPSNTYVAVIETAATTPVISGLTPATDTGSSSTDGITSNTTPVITGTGEANAVLTVKDGTSTLGTVTVGTNGTWSLSVGSALSAGSQSLVATEVDQAGNASAPSNTYVAVIETAATTPVISGLTPATDTGSSSTDGITSNTTPVITGTGEANAVLTVKDGTSTLGTVTVGTNGTWSLSVGSALSAGSQSLVATEVDQAGNASAPSNTYVAVIETAATTPVISGLTPATDTGSSSTDGITSNTTPVITGTGEANAVLTVKDGTSTLGTVTVGTNGTWSLSVGSALSAGSQSLVATEVDQAGNASAPSNTYVAVIETAATTPVISGLTPATDTGSSSTDGITSNTTPVITGTGEANAVLTVKDGTSTLGTVTVGTNGTWSLSVGSALSAGSQSLVATEVDQAGNASAPSNTYVAVIETAATTPVISGLTPATDTGSSSTDGITSNTTPVITGTGEANAVLTVKDGTSTLGTVTVGTNGTWSLSVGSALSAGSQSLVATEVDQAGNASAPSNTYVAVIETAATTPVISGLTPATDTGSSSTDGITSNTTPVITGTGEANAVLTVKDGTSTLGTVTVGTNGTWSLSVGSALSAGSQSLVATEVDQAGNASAPSNTYVAVIETAATTPVISGLTPATDTGSSSTDGITSNTTPVITGTGEANAVLTVKDGTSTLGTVTVGTNGTWSLSVGSALSAGSQSLVATEVDQAGNASAPSNTYVAVIETAATTPVISGLTPATDTGSSSTDGITSNTTPVVAGTGVPSTTITVTDGTSVLGTTTVGTNGTWTLPVTTPLPSGTQTLTATDTDPAGNTSAPSTGYTLTIDTSIGAPTITGLTPATDTGSSSTDGVTSNTTPVVAGTGVPSTTITVTDGTSVLGTTTVGTNGTWTLPVTTPLPSGTQTLTATDTDPAGNTSAPSTGYTLTVATTTVPPVISGITPATDTGTVGDGITSNRDPAIVGTAPAGTVVSVYDGTTLLGTTTAGSTGAWTFTPTIPLADGPHLLTATDTNAAGVTSAASPVYDLVIAPTTVAVIPDQTWTGNTPQTFTVPANTFSVPAGDTLGLTAALVNADGSLAGGLPSWLTLNTATGTFTGTIPLAAIGTLRIQVTANDGHGDTAVASFNLKYQGSPAVETIPVVVHITTTTQTAVPISTAQSAPLVTVTSANTQAFYIPEDISTPDPATDGALQAVKPIVTIPLSPGSDVNYSVGVDTFKDTDKSSNVTLSATLADGQPLPAWLSFDPQSGKLTGTIPAITEPGNTEVDNLLEKSKLPNGTRIIEVLIKARDNKGREAISRIKIQVGAPRAKLTPSPVGNDVDREHASRIDTEINLAGETSGAIILRDVMVDKPRAHSRPGLSTQIRAAHPGHQLVAQAALLRAAERMLHRS